MRRINPHNVIGLAGVANTERAAARRWARRFEAPMILLAILILVEWYAGSKGLFPPPFAAATDWIIWLFFLIETAILTSLVADKPRYLRTNWMNLLIIAGGIPILWGGALHAGALRTLRLLILIPLLLNTSASLRQLLARNHLGVVLSFAAVVIFMAGILIAGLDPAIGSVWDGIWWAWVTVTTVGYGDLVPTSPAGRLFAGLLILFGVGLFSLMTASFSAFFISQQEQQIVIAERNILEKLAQMEQQLQQLEANQERLLAALDAARDKPHPD